MKASTVLTAMLALAAAACQPAATQQPSLLGAWQPERYLIKNADELAVTGQIFFAEQDWTVLFFVLDDAGQPTRGSGEGGTYTLRGDSLTFTHLYHLSAGEAAGGLAESPLRMEIHNAADAATEPCTIAFDDDRLTIHFPSGNAMTFQRRSGISR